MAAAEVGPREDPYDLEVELLPVTVERGRSLSFTIEAAPENNAERVLVTVEGDGFRTEQDAPAESGASLVVDVPVTDLAPRGHLSVIVGYGDDADASAGCPDAAP